MKANSLKDYTLEATNPLSGLVVDHNLAQESFMGVEQGRQG